MKNLFRKLGLNNKESLNKEFFSGALGFLSTIYIVPLTISLYKVAKVENFPIFMTLIISIFISNMIAAFIIKKPAIIGPSIAITVVITKTLIVNLNYSIGNVSSVLIISSFILLLMNIKKIAFKIIIKIPNYLKKYLGISMGLYLMYIGFHQGGFSVIKDNELSLGFLLSEKIWLVLLGCIIIFFSYFKNNKYGALFSIFILSIISIFGTYVFNWNYPKFQSYNDIFSMGFISENYINNLGSGFSNPITYLFGFLISLLTIMGMPSMIHPINKSMGVKNIKIEEQYSNKLFNTISLGSISNLIGSSGYPSLFAETIIVTHSKGRTGFSNFVLAIMFLFSIVLYPIIPILSNNIITAPLLIFIGFISIKSSIKNMDNIIIKEFLVGLFVIVTTIFTNSIPHGLTVGFILNVIVHVRETKEKYINIYTILLALFMVLYEVLIFLINNRIIN